MNKESEIELAKKELINLYLSIKITNNVNIYNYINIYIQLVQTENIIEKNLIKKGQKYNNKKILDIIYLIRDTINAIMSKKVDEKVQQLIISKKEIEDSFEKYEELLRQLEAEIRKHISVEHQLKLQIEKMQEYYENTQTVRCIFFN